MKVVSNTTPINYLISIGCHDLLQKLFGGIFIPQAVFDELQREGTPEIVKEVIASRPDWLIRQPVTKIADTLLQRLHAGEREAILLAEELNADLLLIDERDGRKMASARGLVILGTLGILKLAANRNLLDLQDSLEKLRQSNFRVSTELLESLLQSNK